jgi:hypothetical protein
MLPQRSHLRGTCNAMGVWGMDGTKENRMLARAIQYSEKWRAFDSAGWLGLGR